MLFLHEQKQATISLSQCLIHKLYLIFNQVNYFVLQDKQLAAEGVEKNKSIETYPMQVFTFNLCKELA